MTLIDRGEAEILTHQIGAISGAAPPIPYETDISTAHVPALASNAGPVDTSGPHAECLFIDEHMIVAPAMGQFTPNSTADLRVGAFLHRGSSIGTVGDHEVLSPFSGTIRGNLAQPNERVRRWQPLLWLHPDR